MMSTLRWAIATVLVAALATSAAAQDEAKGPLLEKSGQAGKIRMSLEARAVAEQVGALPVDASGITFETGPLVRTRFRPGLVYSSEMALKPFYVKAELEADLVEGTVYEESTLFGAGYPGTDDAETTLRKAALTLSLGGIVNLTGGYMTSHWGLGLIANDGAHGWKPGSADFSNPVGGDRVLRAMVSVSPLPELKLTAAAAYDVVQGDDALLDDDEAKQWVGALIYNMNKPNTAGVYVVNRRVQASDGAITEALVIDGMAKMQIPLLGMTFKLGAEAALISGTTDLGPNPTYPVHNINSMGSVLRVGLDDENFGFGFETVYASGDANLDDDTLGAFKSDSNFQQGIILHRYVIAAQTARAPHTAADPELSGVPSEDLDRVPTRGALTNTLSFFPRFWWRPVDSVEVYSGLLFALAPAKITDPLETRFAGGIPTNALGGHSGHTLGIEVNAGVRWQMNLSGLKVGAGIEGGIFVPGDAYEDADGVAMEPVSGARLILAGSL